MTPEERTTVKDRLASTMPPEMTGLKQWLVWRLEEAKPKPRKVPYYINGRRRTGKQGSDQDRALLGSFDPTVVVFEKGGWDGVGFAFLPGDDLVGIDLDNAIDPETGKLFERAAKIIGECGSYTEYSPSGRGVHIIGSGQIGQSFKSNDIGVEVFQGSQFFTCTGLRYPGSPELVMPITPRTLKRLRTTVDAAKKKPELAAVPSAPVEIGKREKIESALTVLAPDCGYDDWIQIGMSIKAALGEGGFVVWNYWSSKAPKYPGEKTLASHWKSFNGGSITEATLFGMAKDRGWKPLRPPRKAKALLTVARSSAESGDRGKPPSTPSKAGAGSMGRDPPDDWRENLVMKRGDFLACVANVLEILRNEPVWRGVFGYDEFSMRVAKRAKPPFSAPALIEDRNEWTDVDDTKTSVWITQRYKFAPSAGLVKEAVDVLAREYPFHPVREQLDAVEWDGTKRIYYWLEDYLGVPRSPYSMRVACWYLMGMVKRVYQPGCKFDFCLVLEGKQGRMKSGALRVLGGEFFSDTELDLTNKDSMSNLRGKWLHEFAEMGSLARSETSRQKSFLTRQVDEFRPVFGRREIHCPRQSVFGGTTNELWGWNKDPTGGRRFWPVEIVSEINIDGLAAVRDQLLAEAYVRVKAGKRCSPTPQEQEELFDPEQLSREAAEPYVDMIQAWMFSDDVRWAKSEEFALIDVLFGALKLEASKMTPQTTTRVGIALDRLGCTKIERRTKTPRFMYKRPDKRSAESPDAYAQLNPDSDLDDVPI